MSTNQRIPHAFVTALTTSLVFVLYVVSSVVRTYPVIAPDEEGIIFQAQLFAGVEAPGNMGVAPYYHPGFSILAAPVFWFCNNDPLLAYKLLMLLNAALAAALVPCLVWIGHFFKVRSRLSVAVAGIICMWPSYFYVAHYAWAEACFRLVFALSIVFLIRTIERRGVMWPTMFGGATVAAYAVHPRALLLIPAALFVMAGAFLHKRFGGRTLVASLLSITLTVPMFLVLANYSRETLWDTGMTSHTSRLLSTFIEVRLLTALAVGFGQMWYQVCASLGLAVVGIFVLLKHVRRRSSTEFWPAAFILLATSGIAIASMGQMLGAVRLDHATYGRYIDGASVILVWLGACKLLSDRSTKTLAVAFGVSSAAAAIGAVLVWFWASATEAPAAHPNNVAGVGWMFLENASLFEFIGVTSALALVGMAVLTASPPLVRAGLMAIVVLVSTARIHSHISGQSKAILSTLEASVQAVHEAGGGRIYWTSQSRQVLGLYHLQFALARRFEDMTGIADPEALVISREAPAELYRNVGSVLGGLDLYRRAH